MLNMSFYVMESHGVFPEVLDFEEECRREGYYEGLVKGEVDGLIEGRTAGLQTGFERYLPLGVLQGRVAAWRLNKLSEKQEKAVESLATLASPPVIDNEGSTFSDFERRIKLAKNKARMIATATQSPAVNATELQVRMQKEEAVEEI